MWNCRNLSRTILKGQGVKSGAAATQRSGPKEVSATSRADLNLPSPSIPGDAVGGWRREVIVPMLSGPDSPH